MELIAIQVVLQLSEVVPKVRAIKFCAFLEKFAFTDEKKKREERNAWFRTYLKMTADTSVPIEMGKHMQCYHFVTNLEVRQVCHVR